jgi:hypothetical protein
MDGSWTEIESRRWGISASEAEELFATFDVEAEEEHEEK